MSRLSRNYSSSLGFENNTVAFFGVRSFQNSNHDGLRRSRMTEGRYDAPESFYAKFVSDIRRIFDNATAYNYDADHATDLCQRSSG